MSMALPTDPTLDEVREALAPLLPAHAAFDGWKEAAVDNAAHEAGIAPAIAKLAFANGAMSMIDAWFASIDARMVEQFPPERIASLKIRERITALIEARLAMVAKDRDGLRRALSILAMPQNLPRAAKLGWRAADAIWRAAGDTATDYNHYTKRLTLSAVYSATLVAFLDDESEGWVDTRAFLARRIEDVMRFEKTKARFSARAEQRPSLSRFVGRLRYHAR